MSETGSLDRLKAQAERRKKVLDDTPNVTGRVENTRVNPDKTIDELLRNSKLDQLEEATERESWTSFSFIESLNSNFSFQLAADWNFSSDGTAKRRWEATR